MKGWNLKMYEDYEIFQKPKNNNQAIWRYMDLKKFIVLIEKQAIFFSQSTCLKDSYEGRYPKISKDTIQGNREWALENGHYPSINTPEEKKYFLEYYKEYENKYKMEIRERSYINCWHINDGESAAMWQLYTANNEGVAIKSTFKRLCDSFNNYHDHEIYIGKVKYIDFPNTDIYNHHSLEPLINKRRCFEHENELRALILQLDQERRVEYGMDIPLDINMLIESIYVSPESPTWFYEIITKILIKYEYNFEVIHSNLYQYSE